MNHYTGFRDLTTPVAYVNENAFVNPFKSAVQKGRNAPDGRELDPFFELGTFQFINDRKYDFTVFPRNVWLLESSGPDAADDYNGESYPQMGLIYQPSNGLLSRGDIFRGGGVKTAKWAAALTY
ncbi:MAG: hypothetical protein JXR73_13940 [Candidatus Omnitrophica bacterium]|nr:hypothetical protein [Candidatus Omnitrophota bacterium]